MKVDKGVGGMSLKGNVVTQTFKTPILTTIYRISGVMVLVLGGLIAVITMVGGAMAGSINDHFGIPAFIIAILVACVAICIALPLFGIAQAVEYVGKTAFYSEIICTNLSMNNFELSRNMAKVVARLDGLAETKPTHVTSEADSFVRCPQCNKPISTDSLTKGLNNCPHCGGKFKVE